MLKEARNIEKEGIFDKLSEYQWDDHIIQDRGVRQYERKFIVRETFEPKFLIVLVNLIFFQ